MICDWGSCPRLDIHSRILPSALHDGLCVHCFYFKDGRCRYRDVFGPVNGKE